MRIASWNVNSIKARLGHMTAWLAAQKPDILMMQELKGMEFPAETFGALGYESAFVPQKAYNGVAILSRHKIESVLRSLPGGAADEPARYLETAINGIRLINVYLPNGNPVETEKFTYKLAWLDRLKARLAALRREEVPAAVGGDFNVIPEDIDCHDPLLWAGDALFRPESRARFRALLNLGYTDAFRVFNHAPSQYTFWDYQAGSWPANKGIRIDHFLLSPALTDRLISCVIDTGPRALDKASDHTPVIIELN
jgi:exodeoxyribonuclease III